MKKTLTIIIIAVALFLIVLSQREILTFESHGNTKAYKSIAISYNEPPDLVISKNASLPSVGCKDIKTDMLIQVQKDGVIYYISDGSFLLKREHANLIELLTNPRATFSCKGAFKNESLAIFTQAMPNKSLKDVASPLDSLQRRMLRIVRAVSGCPLALRYTSNEI